VAVFTTVTVACCAARIETARAHQMMPAATISSRNTQMNVVFERFTDGCGCLGLEAGFGTSVGAEAELIRTF